MWKVECGRSGCYNTLNTGALPHRTSKGSCYFEPVNQQTPDKHSVIGWRQQLLKPGITLGLKLIIAIGALLLLLNGNYQAGAETLAILVITFLPYFMQSLFHFRVPAEFETLAIVFIYLSLFLGEVRGFYLRYWWWDMVLHTGSGLLSGIVGFLLVHVLNNNKNINLNLTPKFIALFAFMFAMGIGSLWEIFEFTMDRLFGFTMQKSGLVDTMSDLIVDCGGALVISTLGYWYLARTGNDHFLRSIIQKFVAANPAIFRRHKPPPP